MRGLHGRPVFAAVAALALTALAMGIVPRDLTQQLRLIGADNDAGAMVHGQVLSARPHTLASDPEFPWTVLQVEVSASLLGQVGERIEVFVPGTDARRLSISPPAASTRVGAQVLLFLRADEQLRADVPGAWRADSFAEVFRTQTNRRGQVIVLGQGPGSAVAENVRLDDLRQRATQALTALKSASHGK